MKLEHLQHYITAAKHLSFTKAAKEHYISQAALSQQITQLEEEVGVKLFERGAVGISLTPAGAVFLEEAIRLKDSFEKATSGIRYMYGDTNSWISVGFPSVVEIDILIEKTRSFREIRPDVKVIFLQESLLLLLDRLQNGSCDVVCSLSREIEHVKNIESILGWKDELVLLVPVDHKKADKGTINSKEIAEESLIFVDRRSGRCNIMDMVESCRKDGYRPRFKEVPSADVLHIEVEAGNGVAFWPMRSVHRLSKNIVPLRIVGGTHSIEINFYWRKENAKTDLPAFLEILKKQR